MLITALCAPLLAYGRRHHSIQRRNFPIQSSRRITAAIQPRQPDGHHTRISLPRILHRSRHRSSSAGSDNSSNVSSNCSSRWTCSAYTHSDSPLFSWSTAAALATSHRRHHLPAARTAAECSGYGVTLLRRACDVAAIRRCITQRGNVVAVSERDAVVYHILHRSYWWSYATSSVKSFPQRRVLWPLLVPNHHIIPHTPRILYQIGSLHVRPGELMLYGMTASLTNEPLRASVSCIATFVLCVLVSPYLVTTRKLSRPLPFMFAVVCVGMMMETAYVKPLVYGINNVAAA